MKDFVDAHQHQPTLILLRFNQQTFKVETFRKLSIQSTFNLEDPDCFKKIIKNLNQESNLLSLSSPTEVRVLT